MGALRGMKVNIFDERHLLQHLFGSVAFMVSTVDNRKRQHIAIPKHEHKRLWNVSADKAGDVGKLCTRVGIMS